MKATNTAQERNENSPYVNYDQLALIFLLKGITKRENAVTVPTLAAELRNYIGNK